MKNTCKPFRQISKHLLAIFAGLLVTGSVAAADQVKIGFLVKQAESPWFQDEWRFAEQAAHENGFTLIKIAVPNGEKTIAAIDNLAAQKAQGFIICAPDVKLGVAIERAARKHQLKLMSVDDQLVDGAGKALSGIPHMGISAYQIGREVGQGLLQEMKQRGWNSAEVGAMRLAFDQLPTAKERTQGALDVLKEAGFKPAQLVDAAHAKADTESAFNAANIALTKNTAIKHWLIYGMNDETVLGAVRAAEGRGIKPEQLIGIGINGSKMAQNEVAKSAATGFYATVLLNPKRHGYETAINMYQWITQNKQPPALVLTSGTTMTRQNQDQIRHQFGL